jgi:hypothetical protein
MMIKSDNRALRALLWFVILIVPGGVILLALFAAESMQRRYRAGGVAADPELSNAALSSAALSSAALSSAALSSASLSSVGK